MSSEIFHRIKPLRIRKRRALLLFSICLALLSVVRLSAQDSIMTNSIGMQFVWISPGQFVMGKFQPPYPKPPVDSHHEGEKTNSHSSYQAKDFERAEELARRDAREGFLATIPRAFYIGRFEVTQGQWKKIMGKNPAVFQGSLIKRSSDNLPVENITWEDAQEFMLRLNKLEKGRRYRLPTEAEWEWAARAGSADDISWPRIREMAQLGTRTTQDVGKKRPNAWGLYDMLGNVWEWVQDYYNEKLFADSVPPKTGKVHVLKGASFTGDVKNATYMTHAAGPGNKWDVGLRVVMETNE